MSIKNTAIKTQSGFTIVELLIVIVVIGILAAITIVAFNGVQARAQLATTQQNLSNIKKAIELYHADKGEYPNSANCVNTPGEANYEFNWCGWDQGQGDSFIPGLVPDYIPVIPTLPRSLPSRDSYLYQSGKPDGSGEGGTDQYQLIRYRAPALGGLNAVEKKDNSLILNGGPGGYTGNEAWGYKSNPATEWW
ncbi:MAG: type II secretion system protein [Candidatus Saccharimonadales bacterium]